MAEEPVDSGNQQPQRSGDQISPASLDDSTNPDPDPEAQTDEEPPEQHPWGEEDNPVGIPPKAGYPRLDPRHKEHPFNATST